MNQEGAILALLKARGFKFKRQLGQNFLLNPWLLEQIVDYGQVAAGDCVVEVGAGMGSLTEVLAQRQAKVLALELDRSLIPILQSQLGAYDNIQLLQGDALALDLDQIVLDRGLSWPYKIISNLPYQISTPFLMSLFRRLQGVSQAVIMVQKEVAQKVVATPGSAGYGMLALAAAWFGQAELVCQLEPACFTPPPPVDSAVLRLKRCPHAFAVEERALWTLIRGVLNQRRKNLLNGLKSLGEFQPIIDADWGQVLDMAGIDRQCRGETLSLDQYAEIVRTAGYGQK